MDSLLTPLLSGTLALLGSWVGARIALYRFKLERTFDRQLEWYIGALRTIHGLNLAREQLRRKHASAGPEEYLMLREAFARIVAEAPAYMGDLNWRYLRVIELGLPDRELATERIIRDSEHLNAVLAAAAEEQRCLDDAEEIIMKGLHKLMPPQSDFSALQRLRGKLRRMRKGAKGIVYWDAKNESNRRDVQ